MAIAPRPLTGDENRILRLVAHLYGPANTTSLVTFSGKGDAVIWAQDRTGAVPIMVNLTNVAAFSNADGLSDEEVIDQWLRKPAAG